MSQQFSLETHLAVFSSPLAYMPMFEMVSVFHNPRFELHTSVCLLFQSVFFPSYTTVASHYRMLDFGSASAGILL